MPFHCPLESVYNTYGLPYENNCSVTVPDIHLCYRDFSLIVYYDKSYPLVTEVDNFSHLKIFKVTNCYIPGGWYRSSHSDITTV